MIWEKNYLILVTFEYLIWQVSCTKLKKAQNKNFGKNYGNFEQNVKEAESDNSNYFSGDFWDYLFHTWKQICQLIVSIIPYTSN